MKVFISWSGPLSRRLGEAIKEWLPGVIQLVIPYFTPEDIDKGARWSTEIGKELSESQIGIICVTRDNLHSDWMLFEAGALSKSLENSHVCPVLFGITNTDLAGPLRQFQTTEFERGDFQKLMSVINGRLGEDKLPPKTLENVFAKWWPDLEERVSQILGEEPVTDAPIREDREILEEILQLTRAARRSAQRPVSPAAVTDLVEKFIQLHDQEASEQGDYQATLDSLRRMEKAVIYFSRFLPAGSDEGEQLSDRLKGLSYTVPSNEENGSEESDIPF